MTPAAFIRGGRTLLRNSILFIMLCYLVVSTTPSFAVTPKRTVLLFIIDGLQSDAAKVAMGTMAQRT